jgi:hypothetical protein
MTPVSRDLWLWWTLAGTVGFAVGGPLGVAVGLESTARLGYCSSCQPTISGGNRPDGVKPS